MLQRSKEFIDKFLYIDNVCKYKCEIKRIK